MAKSIYGVATGDNDKSEKEEKAEKKTEVRLNYFAAHFQGKERLQHLVDKLPHACKEFGLTISLKKTNILAQDAESLPVITIDNTELEVVDTFTYLGSAVSSSTLLDAEISFRITKAAAVMAKLNKGVWVNDLLSERTNMCVYQACVLSTLFYGIESWTT
ncbi:uncharacterized protein [Montipora foliosa]|uniref:uncharacterized protein n=1 Tax=Montipora foliosa TaxID=591990 RepID=UPI0035F209FD